MGVICRITVRIEIMDKLTLGLQPQFLHQGVAVLDFDWGTDRYLGLDQRGKGGQAAHIVCLDTTDSTSA